MAVDMENWEKPKEDGERVYIEGIFALLFMTETCMRMFAHGELFSFKWLRPAADPIDPLKGPY